MSLLFKCHFRLIVSAAHCFFREQPSSLTESVVLEDISLFSVAAGKYFRNITATEDFMPQFFNISEIISVPGYDGNLISMIVVYRFYTSFIQRLHGILLSRLFHCCS
jgi:hypothetical protein